MLALSRSTRVVRRLSHNVRALSAVAPSPGSSETTGAEQSDTDSSATHRPQRQPTNSIAECMFVYPWDRMRSSAEGLTIARAVQDKYGPAKEVIFPRVGRVLARSPVWLLTRLTHQDPENIAALHWHFCLVYDDPEVLKRLPEESAQIRVRVADLPSSDGNVGLEDMLRALGSPTTDTGAPHEPEPSSATGETPTNTNDTNDGYKMLDVRVQWARTYLSHSRGNDILLPPFLIYIYM
jgi:hypothetical protein